MSTNRFLVVLIVLLVCNGCGQRVPKQVGVPTEFVEGVVLLDGSPAESVGVAFFPFVSGKGESAFGTTDAKGVFHLTCSSGVPQKGTLEGEYAVTFSKTEKLDPIDPSSMIPSGGQFPSMPEPPKQLLPDIYLDVNSTPFHETVKKGTNKFEFQLESDAR